VAPDLPFGAIEQGVANLPHVPGRFQLVSLDQDDVRVVVDYAHTDDALRNLLETARPLAPARVITVFGCGGDRDRSKRPLMGAVAARLSDVVILTSDNPRSEDPDRIIEEIQRGTAAGSQKSSARAPQVLTIPDRRSAIDRAVKDARAGDLVLIAGKGHERTQTIAGRVLPFDDVEVARAALARRRSGNRVSS
jgi:UDP-N-acetylmuramoyl-L-alanyl-D-glutamate--2,6-diaminopimelate ligase